MVNKAGFSLMLASIAGLVAGQPASALDWSLEASDSRFAGVSVAQITASRGKQTRFGFNSIRYAGTAIGTLQFECPVSYGPICSRGTVDWQRPETDPPQPLINGRFERSPGSAKVALGPARLALEAGGSGVSHLTLSGFPLSWIPDPLRTDGGLASLAGEVGLEAESSPDRLTVELTVAGLEFDTADGRFAGAGLDLDGRADWYSTDGSLSLSANWSAGEALLGPVYLPPPDQPLELHTVIGGQSGDRSVLGLLDRPLSILSFELVRGDFLEVRGSGRLRQWSPSASVLELIEHAELRIARFDLAPMWPRGLQSLAAIAGWGELAPTGSLSGALELGGSGLDSAQLQLADVSVDDALERIRVDGLRGFLAWKREPGVGELELHWDDAGVYRVPLGPSGLRFEADQDGTLSLRHPWSQPVFDGALVVETFAWSNWLEAGRDLRIEARLEPIDLARLTQTLGWVEFGGRISGDFPALRYSGGVLEFDGGIQVDLFGGSARIEQMSVERPFGSLPALSSRIEFDRLDLMLVTGAFEFGAMSGLLSGYIHDLRLLDWQPVAFDAWFETLTGKGDRRISQKAVNSLSNLSGGGGALSGTVLRWFEDFPYRKAGIGCRLGCRQCTVTVFLASACGAKPGSIRPAPGSPHRS
ncbi:MAG: hypothetical protein LC637_09500 [Xanthomonadaceae bacterium]|nr:hypothetical protein [Xanthomonadaceae bacterium]